MARLTKDIVTITCYGKTEQMSRQKALNFYFDCMCNTEGSEKERYTNIYQQLMCGYNIINDLD